MPNYCLSLQEAPCLAVGQSRGVSQPFVGRLIPSWMPGLGPGKVPTLIMAGERD